MYLYTNRAVTIISGLRTTVLKKELRIYHIIQHTVVTKGLELINMFDSMDMSLSNLQERVGTANLGMLQSMGSQRVGHNRGAEQQ